MECAWLQARVVEESTASARRHSTTWNSHQWLVAS